MIPHPLCVLRGIWRTIRYGFGDLVSGHDFEQSTDPTPPNIQIIECKTCGHVSVAWDWTGFERMKP
jgi:hypothetical protein